MWHAAFTMCIMCAVMAGRLCKLLHRIQRCFNLKCLCSAADGVTVRLLLDRRTPPALHEFRKIRNFVWLLIMRMSAAVFLAPSRVPIFSAPVGSAGQARS